MTDLELILPCAICGMAPHQEIDEREYPLVTHAQTCSVDGWTTGPRASRKEAIAAWNTHQLATAVRLANRRAQYERCAA